MSLRLAIAQMDVTEVNVAAFCRDHQISRDRFYTIRRRYEAEGEAGLVPRSRAPNTVANKTSSVVEDLIVLKRKELDDDGFDAGAETIRWHLDEAGVDAPTVSTIWRILTRRGFIVPEPKKAPNKRWRRFVADFVNEMWQTDATHTELADGTEVDIVNILDDHSRVCARSHAVDGSTTGPDAWDAFVVAVETYGIPAWLLSDNGAPFTSKLFTANLEAIEVNTTNSRPYHPQTCGKVERFHQTLKKWLAARDKPDTVEELQVLLDVFVDIYNTKRPHRAIGRRTPIDVFNTAPKTGPDAFSILDETTVHHNKVDRVGRVEIPGPASITVGAAYTGKTATTIRTGNNAHVFIDNKLARKLTIDPTRRSQPLYQRSGRPT
ncbi:MAG: integrase core domain-containing protein [Acidimicrobiia bacterium]